MRRSRKEDTDSKRWQYEKPIQQMAWICGCKGELQISLIRVSCLATEAYATKFIEMILMVTADHGPAVSGAHNTIVTARAAERKQQSSCRVDGGPMQGKDLVSSLCSGLLTIGPRFGGALDDAARMLLS